MGVTRRRSESVRHTARGARARAFSRLLAAWAAVGLAVLAPTLPAAADDAADDVVVASEPAPAPVEEPAPAPVEEPAPAPVEEPAPAPVEEPAPAPVEEPADAPALPADEPTAPPPTIDEETPTPAAPSTTDDDLTGSGSAEDVILLGEPVDVAIPAPRPTSTGVAPAPTAATPASPATPAVSPIVPAAFPLLGWSNPVQGRITSVFGMRVHPVLGTVGMHAGTDVAARCGTPVSAAAAGVVVYVGLGYQGRTGNQVVIAHGDGVITRYGHLLSGTTRVAIGDEVGAGQPIAAVGGNPALDPLGAGNSTGCHLHFEVNLRNGAQPVNPGAFLLDHGVRLGVDEPATVFTLAALVAPTEPTDTLAAAEVQPELVAAPTEPAVTKPHGSFWLRAV